MNNRIGLIGGMSWPSTIMYYEIINKEIHKLSKGKHTAPILIDSLDFGIIHELQLQTNWQEMGKLLVESAKRLEAGNCSFFALATNTMHKLDKELIESTKISFLHIADSISESLKMENIDQVVLLGTGYTMSETFLHSAFNKRGIKTLSPDKEDQDMIHNCIFSELIYGNIKTQSKEILNAKLKSFCKKSNVNSVLLSCTELSLAYNQTSDEIRLFDSAEIHAKDIAKKFWQNY